MSDLPAILGTAGHIDHGKTSLVKALTGVNTDRLAEEQKRGITIELGFAELELPSGRHMGIVDVPGHERFVRHMIAGASGIDLGLLVIAADDGVMPQTREHCKIMELLGIQKLVVALSKIDLVDPDWIELAKSDIESYLEDSIYKGSEIIAVSSHKNIGLVELLAALDRALSSLHKETRSKEAVRLPIDRVFSLKGVGTVITGTLWSGTIEAEQNLEIVPSKIQTRVRSVQVHSKHVDKAFPGQRVAVNLAGLETKDIGRGNTLCSPGTLIESSTLDVMLSYLGKESKPSPLKSGSRVHLNHGTSELLGRVLLMNDQKELDCSSVALAQIRLEEPLYAKVGDPFIIRSYSPVELIGGGRILLNQTRMRTHLLEAEERLLKAQFAADTEAILSAALELYLEPFSTQELSEALGIDSLKLQQFLDKHSDNKLSSSDKPLYALSISSGKTKRAYINKAKLRHYFEAIEERLLAFHKEKPLHSGMSEQALSQSVAKHMPAEFFAAIIALAAQEKLLEQSEGLIAHPSAGLSAKRAEEEIAHKLMAILQKEGLGAPFLPDLARQCNLAPAAVKRSLRLMQEAGKLVKINPEFYVTTQSFDEGLAKVKTCLQQQQAATTSELRELLAVSRKYAVPFLSYLDDKGITYRDDDKRRLK